HAAIVLRPWTVDRAVDDHVADLAGAQLLRLRWEAESGIDLSVGEELHRRAGGTGDPVDILRRIEPDMRRQGGDEHVRGGAEVGHANGLASEVRDAADTFLAEQLEAADMDAADDRDLLAGIDRNDKRGRKVQCEVDLAARNRA